MSQLKKFKIVRYFLEYIVVTFFCYSVRLLPLGFSRILACVAGCIMYLVPCWRKIALSNIMVAFPEKSLAECKDICKKSLKNTILVFLEFSWFYGSPDRIKKYVKAPPGHGELIDYLIKDKKALIYCTGHFGNWDLHGLSMTATWPQMPFAVVARTSPNPFFSKLLDSARSSTSNIVIPAKGAVKEMMKGLHNGYFMATLIDQNTKVRDGGIFVDFFGLPVPASRAPAMFGRKMKIKLLMAYCIRKESHYEMIFDELPKQASEYADDHELMQVLMTAMENMIRKYPEQYVWFYKRFQTIPREASPELAARYPYYSAVAEDKFYFKKIS